MIFDFDPRSKKDGLQAESYPARLLKDILTGLITRSMSTGTASNYITHSYGSNHRILYEGVASLLADVLVSSTDNIEDGEFSQMRAEFISTRLLYQVFPDEQSVPEGDNIQEVINILLQTYSALLEGATKKSIDEALNDIANNATVTTDIRDYVANLSTAILATTELSTVGVPHRHYAFTNEKGLGSTNKPLGYRWGDNLHYHEIIDGVIQPYVDAEGNSHTHEIFLGLPENIIRLQSNLSKVFEAIKPAHLKTGSVASILEEGDRLLEEGNLDNVSGNLFTNVDETETEGRVAVSLGSIYQEDMRRSRAGTWDEDQFAYVSGRELRFWRSNIEVADNLVAIWETQEVDQDTGLPYTKVNQQKIRVISTRSEAPSDRASGFTVSFVRDLGTSEELGLPDTEIRDGLLTRARVGGVPVGYAHNPNALVDDGEAVLLSDTNEVFFTLIQGDEGVDDGSLTPYGKRVRLSAQVVEVDAVLIPSGMVLIRNQSLAWTQRDTSYETLELTKDTADPLRFDLGVLFQARVSSLLNGLPLRASDFVLSLERGGVEVDLSGTDLFYDFSTYSLVSEVATFQTGDLLTITFPQATGLLKPFSELNNDKFTLNAVRQPRYVSEGGRGGNLSRRVRTWLSETSYVLNDVSLVSPFTRTEKKTTYSASTTDSLNNRNQTLNSTFTLNHGELGLSLSQDQVFKPATKTLTTSNPKVSFYQLGFKPSFLTSVVDSEGTSYTYRIDGGYAYVEGLEGEKTLTFTAISSKPLDLDSDWFKGETLAEGQAFWELQDLDIENTPSEIHNDPLGVEPDQNRTKYAQRRIEESGDRGELDFFSDTITRYDLDGRSGFTNEYNPHQPTDVVLGQDYSVYKLGPITTIEGETFNTIPTYLYFNYFFLNSFGGDGYYFSIYRLSPDGVKYYQTITPIADSSGFFAIEEYPQLPAPNGAPLAYRLRDFTGSPNSFTYENGDFQNNYTAEINASFNHIPFQTYYIELFMEEDGGGADNLLFFSQGTNAPYTLNTDWLNSNETYRLDDPLLGAISANYTYQVTFATNPGEVTSFGLSGDPDPLAPIEVEDVGAEATIGTVSYGPSEFLYGIRYLQLTPPLPTGWFTFEYDQVPEMDDAVDYSPGRELFSTLPDLTDNLGWSLYLLPANISHTTADITDAVTSFMTFERISREDDVPLASDGVSSSLSLLMESGLPIVSDLVSTGINLLADVEDEIGLSDEALAFISSIGVDAVGEEVGVSDQVQAFISQQYLESAVDLATDASTSSLGLVPEAVGSDVPVMGDGVETSLSLAGISESSSVPLTFDEVTSLVGIQSTITASLPLITDGDSTNYLYTTINVDGEVDVSDDLSVSFLYAPQDLVELGGDEVTFSLELSRGVASSVSATTDDLEWNLLLYPATAIESVPATTDDHTVLAEFSVDLEDEVSISDEISQMITLDSEDSVPLVDDLNSTATLNLAPKNVVGDVPAPSDTTSVLISTFSVSGSVDQITDDVVSAVGIESSVESSVPLTTDAHTEELGLDSPNPIDNVPVASDEVLPLITSFAVSDDLPDTDDAHSTTLVLESSVESSVPLITVGVGDVTLTVDLLDSSVTSGVPAPTDTTSILISSLLVGGEVPDTEDALTTSLTLSADVSSSVPLTGSNSVESLYLNDANLAGEVPLTTDALSASLTLGSVSLTSSYPLTTDAVTGVISITSSLAGSVPEIEDASTSFITLSEALTGSIPATTDDHTALILISSSQIDSYPLTTDTHTTDLNLGGATATDTVPLTTDNSTSTIAISSTLESEVEPVISDDHTALVEINSSQTDSYPLTTDAHVTQYALGASAQSSDVPEPTDSFTSLVEISSSQSDSYPLTTDDSSDQFSFYMPATTDSVPEITDDVSFVENSPAVYLYMVLNYNSFSNLDEEYLSLYTGEQDTLEYPAVVSKMPDSNGLSAFDIVEEDGVEVGFTSSINAQYSNSSDALLRYGPIDTSKTYHLYAQTNWDDQNPPDMYLANKSGPSAMDPHGLTSLDFFEVFPDYENSGTDSYYIHDINFNSVGQPVKPSTTATRFDLPYQKNDVVRLYFYMVYKYAGTLDNNDGFRWRPAPAGATYTNPNGTNNVLDTFYAPTIHDTNNYSYFSDERLVLFPNGDDANSNNYSQVSWAVEVGVRYHLQAYIYDHSGSNDLTLYLEARDEDNGASYNTEYDSTSTLNYSEIVTDENNKRREWNHFFTVRQDGFIIWELAPNGV